jgi:hypothetical protein
MPSQLSAAFAGIPWWFIAVGLAISAYHTCRGYILQCAFAHYQQSKGDNQFATWSRRKTTLIRCIYDGFFYCVCSVAGFAALWLAAYIVNTLPTIQDIPSGTSAFLVFLIVLGLLGVSGQLPYLIQLGKVPK